MMMIPSLKIKGRFPLAGIALLLILFGALGVANAATTTCGVDAWSPTPAANVTVNWNASNVNLGDVFTANTSGTVCALGIYAGNNSSYTKPETVALYTIGGTLLTSTTVTTADTLYDNYYWNFTNPVHITAGLVYVVVDFTNGNGWGYGPAPTDHWGNFNYNDYVYSGGLQFPIYTGGSGPTYYGANAMMTPEPCTMLLLGSGIMGLAGALRRKFVRG